MEETVITLKVGMYKEDITPKLGCLLYGYPRERRAVRVLDRLYVSVLALEQGEERVLLVSADLCCIDREWCERIRQEIADATGVRKRNILYTTIHTHSGPITHTSAGWGEADVEYISEVLIPCSIKAAQGALQSMQPAKMGVGITETMAGINRREVDSEGRVILGQNPSGAYDPTMTVIAFRTMADEMIGSIIHFAAHPTSVGSNASITRDWPSFMVDRLEAVTGTPCMYINGAEGDVGPRLSNGMTTGEEHHAEEIGLIAAEDAQRAYYSIQEYAVPKLALAYGEVVLPFVEPPAVAVVEKEIEAMGDPEKLAEVQILKYAQLQKIRSIYQTEQCQFPKGLEFEETVLSLGELAFVPVPFEAFCEVALSLREQSPFQMTLLVGLAGGDVGYLPTEEQVPYGGYEVDSFHTLGVLSLVDSADKELVKQSAKLLRQMKNLKEGSV